ncbi:hypothetical protein GPJ59_13765 [Streptomyces bambusae]|uniref:TIR domain-containing protein n=1 Tax=Streptomyces bambusae TaxID=1550616 RepID=A0ABS6Z883_9ACTN|nr:hypothetical protein [Streptomyces bambusae]
MRRDAFISYSHKRDLALAAAVHGRNPSHERSHRHHKHPATGWQRGTELSGQRRNQGE